MIKVLTYVPKFYPSSGSIVFETNFPFENLSLKGVIKVNIVNNPAKGTDLDIVKFVIFGYDSLVSKSEMSSQLRKRVVYIYSRCKSYFFT